MMVSNTVEIADILSSAICRIKHLLFRIKKLRIVWLKADAICWMGWQFQTWARPLTVNELDNILLQSQGFKNYLFWQSWSIIYGLYWLLVVNTVTAAHVLLDHEPIRARIEYKLSGFELTGWWFKPPTPSFSDHSIVTPQPLISSCVADSPVNFAQFEPCKLCRLAHLALNGTARRCTPGSFFSQSQWFSKPTLIGLKRWPCCSVNKVEHWRTSVFCRGSTGLESS